MNVEKFNKMLEERIEKTRQVLNSKNKEYASNSDKLHNFKRAGDMLRQTPEQALVGMWTKHIISILDIVDQIDTANRPRIPADYTLEEFTKYLKAKKLTIATVEEKIGDAVNYLILLEALIKERYEE